MTYEAVYSDHVKLTELHEEQSMLKARLEELYETRGILSEDSTLAGTFKNRNQT